MCHFTLQGEDIAEVALVSRLFQRWRSAAASMSCAVTRNVLARLLHGALEDRIHAPAPARSRRVICCVFLYRITHVREITRKARILARSEINASVMPAAK